MKAASNPPLTQIAQAGVMRWRRFPGHFRGNKPHSPGPRRELPLILGSVIAAPTVLADSRDEKEFLPPHVYWNSGCD